MRVLFLDFDGVIATPAGRVYWVLHKVCFDNEGRLFDPIACSNLQYILDRVPDLKIVVSSTWRCTRTHEQIKEILKMNEIDAERFIGMTPVLAGGTRGDEIAMWLKNNPVDDFLIVDDEPIGSLEEKFVKTRSLDGLTYTVALEIMQRFGVRNDYIAR